jgi:type II secretory pathway pseudopilin PulG
MVEQRVRHHRVGFTLVELLVVIGIITILITILLPIAANVRKTAYATATSAEISRIAAACQAYYGDYHSYPGPVAENDIDSGTPGTLGAPASVPYAGVKPITSSENLVLGLCGGLNVSFNTASPPSVSTFTYSPTFVGNGPQCLSPLLNSQKQTSAYLTVQPSELAPSDGAGGYEKFGSSDSKVPEFVDHIPGDVAGGTSGDFQFGPILYFRARVGAAGIVNETAASGVGYQYNFMQAAPYGFTAVSATDFPPGNYTDSVNAYFANHGIAGTAKGHDAFLLISAGTDRIFGTKDDIIFGN